MRSRTFCLGLCLLPAAFGAGCSFTSTAKRWNDRVDKDGNPVYYEEMVKVGLKLLIIVPFLGDMGITGMVEDLSEDIETNGGDHLMIVQGNSENYWYGWPPFTWILTPVISTVSAEFRPSAEMLAKDRAELAEADVAGHSRWYKPWSW